MIEVKQKINYNDSLCGTISKQDTGTYTIFIKIKTKTNPSWNKADFWRCTNVFYGRRVVSKGSLINIKQLLKKLSTRITLTITWSERSTCGEEISSKEAI